MSCLKPTDSAGSGVGPLVQRLIPVKQNVDGATLADLRKIIPTLPHLDRDNADFEADVLTVSNLQLSTENGIR